MRLEVEKYLQDILDACIRLVEFTGGKSYEDYRADSMLRAAVERQFEIDGEALNRLSQLAPEVAEHVTDRRRIIAFRNLLVHGYADIDDRVVWGVVETKLEALVREVRELLE